MLDGTDPTEGFIVHHSDRQVGFVQRYLIVDDPDWRETVRSAIGEDDGIGIDYLIGERGLVGKGLGRQMISEFIDQSWRRYHSEDRVVVVRQQENIASWKALEECGFGPRLGRPACVVRSKRSRAELHLPHRPTRRVTVHRIEAGQLKNDFHQRSIGGAVHKGAPDRCFHHRLTHVKRKI